MPKDLGTESVTRKRVRSVDVFQLKAAPTGDILDVYPLVELRDPDQADALVGTEPLPPQRFSQSEIEEAIEGIEELPEDYATLRIGIAKLMHKLLDTR